MWIIFIFFIIENCYLQSEAVRLNSNSFPDDFLFGVSSSAYQTEGSWDVDDKEPSVWDTFTHDYPDKITNNSNSDVACNSYKNIKEDVELLKNLGVNVYKFSISWARIITNNKMNHNALEQYNKLIDSLVAEDITPMVTLFHWDTPQSIQSLGGWLNPYVKTFFVEYARLAFEMFGDRVKYWITFNDPLMFCLRSYTDTNFPPIEKSSDLSVYLCSHVILNSHGAVYKLYENTFKNSQNGMVSISLGSTWFSAETTSENDTKAANTLMEFTLGQFAEPIFGNGNYPTVMRNNIKKNSIVEGYLISKLPKLTKEDMNTIKGSADFFALEFYTSAKVSHKTYPKGSSTTFFEDISSNPVFDDMWHNSILDWIQTDPESLRKMLNYIKRKYGNIPIYITENGYPDSGQSEDYDRINYIQTHLSSILDALQHDNVNVIGYNVRSLLDSFEWTDGYSVKFGLYQVDFKSSDRQRTPKLSAEVYKEIIENRKLPGETSNKS